MVTLKPSERGRGRGSFRPNSDRGRFNASSAMNYYTRDSSADRDDQTYQKPNKNSPMERMIYNSISSNFKRPYQRGSGHGPRYTGPSTYDPRFQNSLNSYSPPSNFMNPYPHDGLRYGPRMPDGYSRPNRFNNRFNNARRY